MQKKPVILDDNGNPIQEQVILDDNGNPIQPQAPEKEGFLKRAWRSIAEAPKVVQDFTTSLANYIDQPSETLNRIMPSNQYARGLLAGSLKAGIDMMATPLNLATAGKMGIAKYAAKAGWPVIEKIATTGAKALMYPVMGHGAINTLHPESTIPERLFGVAEMAGGRLGLEFNPRAGKLNQIAEQPITESVNLERPTAAISGEVLPSRDDIGRAWDENNVSREQIESLRRDVLTKASDNEILEATENMNRDRLIRQESGAPPTLRQLHENKIIEMELKRRNLGVEIIPEPATAETPLTPPINITPKFGQKPTVEPNISRIAVNAADEATIRRLEFEGFVTSGETNQRGKLIFERQPQIDEPLASRVLDFDPDSKLIKQLERETDPEVALDNLRNLEQELEWQKLHGTADDIERAGFLKDVALDKVKQIQGKGLFEQPDFTKPQAARTSEGKVAIGADIKSLGRVLGSSLYEGNITKIATKELVQNSLDAIRPLGETGNIEVYFDRPNRIINVADNGKGLTQSEIESIFTDLGASGKRNDETAIGGFGLAKAAPLLGGERVKVISIADDVDGRRYRTEFEGTPDELLEGVEIRRVEVDKTHNPTGTDITVTVPDEHGFYDAKEYLEKLATYSEFPGQIKFSRGSFEKKTFVGKRGGQLVVELQNDSAKTKLIIPEDAKPTQTAYIQLMLANKGMYQSSQVLYLPTIIDGIPNKLIVDIDAIVPEGSTDYPFTGNREHLRGSVAEQVQKYVEENVIKPAINKSKEQLIELYENMPVIEAPSGKKIYFYNTGGKTDPSSFHVLSNNPRVLEIGEMISRIIDETLILMDKPEWIERLDRTGIILDEKLRGIHIPNPKDGKSAILINPFTLMEKSSPDSAAAGFVHTILHEIAHVEKNSPGHNEPFAIRMADIYEKFGARRTVQAQEEFLNIVTDNTGSYTDEIFELLSVYNVSRRNKVVRDDALTGTGIDSKTSNTGTRTIFANAQENRTGIGAIWIKNPTPEKVKQAVLQGYKVAGEMRDDGAIKMVPGGDRTAPILESEIGQLRPTEGHIGKLADERKSSIALELINLPRGIMASNDFSAPLRQGLPLIHRKEWWTSWDDMFKAWGSEDAFRQIQQSIADKPLFKPRVGPVNPKTGKAKMLPSFAEDAGLKLTDLTDLSVREEAIMSTWAEYVPGVRRSNRAYVAFLNKLRADTFENLIRDAGVLLGDKPDLAVAREIADYVNTSTGRGSLGTWESSAVKLNSIFFSPRLIASRLRMLNPLYYYRANPFVRKQALKSLFAWVGFGNAIVQLGRLTGAEVEVDPRSSDFMKVRIGDKVRLDPWGGFQQYAVFVSKFLSGQAKSTTTGNMYELTGLEFGRPSRFDTAVRFGESKLNPVWSFATGWMHGKDFTGQPFNVPEEIASRFVPIFVQDLISLAQEEPGLVKLPQDIMEGNMDYKQIPLGVPAGFGMSIQKYTQGR